MKPTSFEYHSPATLDAALAVLAGAGAREGRVLAGGQSLLPTMALRLARPAHLIDINGIAELAGLRVENNELVIGACVRHAAFERTVEEGPLGRLLAHVVRHIAHYPIRTRGTFCGSLAQADPAAEWCLVAATLSARMVIASAKGRRVVNADAFFEGPMMTALRDGELLIEARLPLLSAGTHTGFCEFSRRAGDFAIAMALVTYELRDGVISEARVGIGGAEDRPRRIAEAEAAMRGKPARQAVFEAVADAAAQAISPARDIRYCAEYRRDAARAMVLRALAQAAGDAR